ncbi:scabin-related ADP-ribosyltransferase [Microbacterium murale]|uniref:Pierisin-like domain-containing protein n=1 Tax=Microbacterium murale TaxID=1081040 RepID=A0ABQ1S3I7_9MICO|nr:hypothetical protein [Microbacterium murale]GGD89983.1 hypothetical protein GCM10007269_35730 [Microbacterium murale]
MSAFGRAFADLWHAMVKGGKDANVRLPEVARKVDDHLEDLKQKVKLLDGTDAPDLTGSRTNRVDRTTTEALYRGDNRPPSTIFEEGFQVRDASNNDYNDFVRHNTHSNFVSTTTSPDLNWPAAYRYSVDAPGGIDADATIPDNPFGPNSFRPEREITFQGGIPRENIVGAHPVGPGGTLGDWVPNPHYSGGR